MADGTPAGIHAWRWWKSGRHCISRSNETRTLIVVNVNGATQRCEPNTNVSALLERLQLAGKRVAVERNGEIVPRSRFGETALANGDRLEIVVAVGGG